MFERFTDLARRVVVQAQEEARALGHNYIGTEHILLGLLGEREGAAAQALSSLGVSLDLDAAREQVVEIAGAGTGQLGGHVPFTPRTKKVLELSLREAQRLGHDHIGTEHILLGLVREGEGVGAQILERQGASLDRVQAQVLATVRTAPAEELRQVSVGRMPGGMPASITLRAVMSRLDEIAERLTAIENLLAEMRDPAGSAAQSPSSGQGKPAGAAQPGPPGGGEAPTAKPPPPAGGEAPPGQPEPPVAQG